MQVVHGNGILYSAETKIIGGSINRASLDSAARHPQRITPVVVVTAQTGSGSVLPHFDRGCSAELAGTHNESFIKHPALLEINN